MKSLKARADNQARFAVAARINRVPHIVTELCRALVDRTHWRLVGTNSLYA